MTGDGYLVTANLVCGDARTGIGVVDFFVIDLLDEIFIYVLSCTYDVQ